MNVFKNIFGKNAFHWLEWKKKLNDNTRLLTRSRNWNSKSYTFTNKLHSLLFLFTTIQEWGLSQFYKYQLSYKYNHLNEFHNFDPLSENPTKLSNTLKQFVGKLPTNCRSVFDHFVGLVLKGLIRRVDLNQVFLF